MKTSLKQYCVVIMAQINGSVKEIEEISNSSVNFIDATGILIATFSSFYSVKEISEHLQKCKRSYLIFDLDPNYSGVEIRKKSIHEALFGLINNPEDVEILSKDIFDGTIEVESKTDKPKELTEADIAKLEDYEKKELFDKIFEKGVENFTENDKKIIPLLV